MADRAKTKVIQLQTVKTFADWDYSGRLLGNLITAATFAIFQDSYRLYTWFKPVKTFV